MRQFNNVLANILGKKKSPVEVLNGRNTHRNKSIYASIRKKNELTVQKTISAVIIT